MQRIHCYFKFAFLESDWFLLIFASPITFCFLSYVCWSKMAREEIKAKSNHQPKAPVYFHFCWCSLPGLHLLMAWVVDTVGTRAKWWLTWWRLASELKEAPAVHKNPSHRIISVDSSPQLTTSVQQSMYLVVDRGGGRRRGRESHLSIGEIREPGISFPTSASSFLLLRLYQKVIIWAYWTGDSWDSGLAD